MRKFLMTLTAFTMLAAPAFAGSYEVEGYDENGNYVYGEVESNGGRNVEGYIYDEDGNERHISGQWNGSNGYSSEIEATDDDGNSIELETD